jgi:hypothetical protein
MFVSSWTCLEPTAMADHPPALSDRDRLVLHELLNNWNRARTAADLGRAIRLPAGAVADVLRGLADGAWVDVTTMGRTRFYQLVEAHLPAAAAAVGRTTPQIPASAPLPVVDRPAKPPAAAAAGEDRVWTVPQLRAAVARGEEKPATLAYVEKTIAALRERARGE